MKLNDKNTRDYGKTASKPSERIEPTIDAVDNPTYEEKPQPIQNAIKMSLGEDFDKPNPNDYIPFDFINREVTARIELSDAEIKRAKERQEKELEESFKDGLLRLAKKHNQVMEDTKFSTYLFKSGQNVDWTIENKGGIQVINRNINSDALQDYVALVALHKFAKSPKKKINLEINEDMIADSAVATEFFNKSMKTLVDNGIDVQRLNIVNPKYKHLHSEFMDKLNNKDNAPAFKITEGDELVVEKLSGEEARVATALKNKFHIVTKSVGKNGKLSEFQNGFDKTDITVSHSANGEYTNLSTNYLGDKFQADFKTADLVHGEFVHKLMTEKATLDNKATASPDNTADQPANTAKPVENQTPAIQGIQGVTDTPTPAANPTTPTVQPDVASGKSESQTIDKEVIAKSIKEKIAEAVAISAGSLDVLDKEIQKLGLDVKLDETGTKLIGEDPKIPGIEGVFELKTTTAGQFLETQMKLEANDTFANKEPDKKKSNNLLKPGS